jgi:hypothetical protein
MPGDLTFPSDVAADRKGRLYVAERVGQRFQILEMANGSAATDRGLTKASADDPRERVRAEVGAFNTIIRRARR